MISSFTSCVTLAKLFNFPELPVSSSVKRKKKESCTLWFPLQIGVIFKSGKYFTYSQTQTNVIWSFLAHLEGMEEKIEKFHCCSLKITVNMYSDLAEFKC